MFSYNFTNFFLFGITQTFFAGFGQTFLFALFAHDIATTFALTRSEIGFLFGGITLASAFCLPFVGKKLNPLNLNAFILFTATLFIGGLLTLGFANSLLLLFIGLFLLRFAGHSLMPHICDVAAAYKVSEHKGKVLGATALGYPLGELLIPPLVAGLLLYYNWQASFLMLALLGLIIYLPLSIYLGSKGGNHLIANPPEKKASSYPLSMGLILPSLVAPCFLLSGLFFFQSEIAALKGISLSLLGFCFPMFALTRLFGSFFGGIFIDRFSASILLPFLLIPQGIGIISLLLIEGVNPIVSFLLFFGGTGATLGLATPLFSTIWSEVYGASHASALRSLAFPIIVAGSALSPPLFGLCLDAGFSLESIVIGSIALLIFSAIPAFLVGKINAGQNREWQPQSSTRWDRQ